MTEEGLLFICDEAACKADSMFYELFPMEDRWDIIKAILKAVQDADPLPPADRANSTTD